MKRLSKNKPCRRGAVGVLVPILLPLFLGLMALVIDVGWMYLTKAELGQAADSAALAGASQLANGYVSYSIPGQNQKCTILAASQANVASFSTNFAAENSAGGVRSLVLNNADIHYGFTDSKGNYTSPCNGYPNTVKVLMRRDASANGPLGLFLAEIFGMSNTTMTASAAATAAGGTIVSFNPNLGVNGLLLPVTLDVNEWNQFLATGKSPDGNVYSAANGAPQIQVYPSPGNAPGNFGLVCPGSPSNSASQYSSWVSNGPTSADLQYLQNNGLVPVSSSAPQSWKGSPGLKSSLSSDFAGAMGQPRLLPVFQPVSTSPYQAASGNGSNASYQIVGFVGVTITQASGNGNNMNISIQPTAVADPTAIYDPTTIAPLGTTSNVMTTVVPAYLSQ